VPMVPLLDYLVIIEHKKGASLPRVPPI